MRQLYGYFRSSAAYRVRIALNLKKLDYERVFISLARGPLEQVAPDYVRLNPQGLVPTLVEDGHVLPQSLAIIEYLEETHPAPLLLPPDPLGRARVRALALVVACEIHPLNNLRVLNFITKDFGLAEADMLRWYRHWIATGMQALETMLAGHPATREFCHGDRPTLADVCLVPQVFNARRYDCPLDAYPTVVRIADRCAQLKPFADASPLVQPDRV